MAKEVGRNDPCPCGSGRKFKKCCAEATQPAGRARPGSADREVAAVAYLEKKRLLFPSDLIAKQIRVEARACEESFERHFGSKLDEFSKVASQVAALVYSGLMASQSKPHADLRRSCGLLLVNALELVVSGTDALRRGHRLAPSILARSALEAVATAAVIDTDEEKWHQYKKGKLITTKTPSWAEKVIPGIGRQYGLLSNSFAHPSEFYETVNAPIPFDRPDDPAAVVVLTTVRSVLIEIWIAAELIFAEFIPQRRFWKREGMGHVFGMTPETEEWFVRFTGVGEVAPDGAGTEPRS